VNRFVTGYLTVFDQHTYTIAALDICIHGVETKIDMLLISAMKMISCRVIQVRCGKNHYLPLKSCWIKTRFGSTIPNSTTPVIDSNIDFDDQHLFFFYETCKF